MASKPRNDRNQAVTKFCLAMEDHRRTEAGRVRTAREFVAQFFPWDERAAKDLLFRHIPMEIRGPVLAAWGIRGAKAALRDDDEKVQLVVHDALVAGDIDEPTFEQGVTPQILVDWIPLLEWWSFWRHGKLTGVAIQKALATARELGLIDDRWFLQNVQGRGGKLKGTDVLCDTLSKDQIVGWIRKIHETGDGSPAGIVGAIGWETVLAKTAQDALLFALDAFARKAGLSADAPPPVAQTSTAPSSVGHPVSAVPQSALPASPSPASAPQDEVVDTHPTVNAPADAALAAQEAAAAAEASARSSHISIHDRETLVGGMPVAIPESPAIDNIGGDDDAPPTPLVVREEESPKLAEARAQMMAMLKPAGVPAAQREPWDDSEIPAKPSSLEWPEPPPIVVENAPNGKSEGGRQKAASPVPPSEDVISLDDDALLSERLPVAAPVAKGPPTAPKPPPLGKGGPPPLKR